MVLSGFKATMICDQENNRAILVKISDGREIWIPRTVIKTFESENEATLYSRYFIEVPYWFARSEKINSIDRNI